MDSQDKEAAWMARNMNILFLYQILVVLWMSACVSVYIALGFALFNLEEPGERKRPGINLKAL
jgi:hypothetical protein